MWVCSKWTYQMCSDKLEVFIVGPRVLIDVGVEVVVPALAALLALSSGQHQRNARPLLGAVELYVLTDELVFFLGPLPLDEASLEEPNALGAFHELFARSLLHGERSRHCGELRNLRRADALRRRGIGCC